jgi:hypothetical protein
MPLGRPIAKATVKGRATFPEVQSTQGTNANDTTTNIYVQTILGTSADVSDAERLDLKPIQGRIVKPPAQAPDFEPLETDNVVATFERVADAPFSPQGWQDSPATTTTTTEIELDEFVENPKLKRFRAKRADKLELTVDVSWLKHVIHVLIANHSITISPRDVHDIMQYFDSDCEIRVKKKRVVERSASEPTCCGTTEQEREVVIETISKIIVSGLNIIKTSPPFIGFLTELGLAF